MIRPPPSVCVHGYVPAIEKESAARLCSKRLETRPAHPRRQGRVGGQLNLKKLHPPKSPGEAPRGLLPASPFAHWTKEALRCHEAMTSALTRSSRKPLSRAKPPSSVSSQPLDLAVKAKPHLGRAISPDRAKSPYFACNWSQPWTAMAPGPRSECRGVVADMG